MKYIILILFIQIYCQAYSQSTNEGGGNSSDKIKKSSIPNYQEQKKVGRLSINDSINYSAGQGSIAYSHSENQLNLKSFNPDPKNHKVPIGWFVSKELSILKKDTIKGYSIEINDSIINFRFGTSLIYKGQKSFIITFSNNAQVNVTLSIFDNVGKKFIQKNTRLLPNLQNSEIEIPFSDINENSEVVIDFYKTSKGLLILHSLSY
jgi:hypothetical protein